MPEFVCPQWAVGQACHRYFKIPFWGRAFSSFLGALTGLAAPSLNVITAIQATPANAPFSPAVWLWGVGLSVTGVAGIFFALHHEKDIWGCFLTSAGTPSCLLALAALPQLTH